LKNKGRKIAPKSIEKEKQAQTPEGEERGKATRTMISDGR
jgi:hypothetical protein